MVTKKGAVALLCVALAAAPRFSGAQTLEATGDKAALHPEDPPPIVFTRYPMSDLIPLDAGVYVVEPETGEEMRISGHVGPASGFTFGYHTALSPSGRRIAFSGSTSNDERQNIFLVDVDGTNLHKMARITRRGDTMPSWAPDERRLAVMRIIGSTAVVDRVRTDGSHRKKLVGFEGWSPQWSPDGRFVTVHERGLFLVRSDGTHLWRLVRRRVGGVDWHPTLRKLVFPKGLGKEADLFEMNLNTGRQKRLTNDYPIGDRSPVWSPDGTKIAFVRRDAPNEDVYIMNADGTGVTRLTESPRRDFDPVWSSDGRHIAFVSRRDGNFEIYSMRADGSNETRLTTNPGDDLSPDW